MVNATKRGMSLKPAVIIILAIGTAGVITLLLNSCSTTPGEVVVPLEIPGAHYVGNRACLDCHAEIVREFPASPHARVHFEDAAMAGDTGCESCHGPGSKHIESGGNAQFIINPGNDPASCFQCHLDVQAEFNLPQHHPVIEGHMNCVSVPRSARGGYSQAERRFGDGPAERELRAMPSRADAPVCV